MGRVSGFVDYDIRSQGEEPFTVPTDQRVMSSVLEVNRTGSEHTPEASSNEFFEQGVHREEEGKPHCTAGRGALPLPREEKPGEAVQVVKRGVGAVEAYRFPKWVGRIADRLETGGELGEPPAVVGRACKARRGVRRPP